MEADFNSASSDRRVQRAMTLIAASLVVIACSGILYAYPAVTAFGGGGEGKPAPVLVASYRIGAVDFVTPRVGWVVALMPTGDVTLLNTTDGGRSWKRQLTVAGDVHPQYVKFFDETLGVFALLGTRPAVYITSDGGESWSMRPALGAGTAVVSWSFVDRDDGWMLARDAGAAGSAPVHLYQTSDGGNRWVDLGAPLRSPEQAYQVHFSSAWTGWLAASGPAAHAYRSDDAGATWTPVALPAPQGGWPGTGQFFVGVQPTQGAGVLASVVYFPPIKGRTGVGASIRAFPPLTVRSFDGGRPYTYKYTTVLDRLAVGGRAGDQPPNETVLSTIDDGATWVSIRPPATSGAIGYFDAEDWWWIGAGSWSTSADAGETWSAPERIGAMEPLPGMLQVLDGNHAWLAASATRTPLLQTTDDAGRHWRLVTLPPLSITT